MLDMTNQPLFRFAWGILFAAVALVPVFFIPAAGVPLDIAKQTLLQAGTILAAFFFLVAVLRSGHVSIPKSGVLLAGFILVAALLVAAVVSPAAKVAILGFGNEVGTVLGVGMAVLLFLLAALLSTQERVEKLYMALGGAAALLALWHIVRFFAGPDTLSFSLFGSATDSLIGKWNDLAVLAGLVTVSLLIFLESGLGSVWMRRAAYVGGVLAIAFLVLVNFSFAWAMVAAFSLLVLVYQVSFGRRGLVSIAGGAIKLPVISLVVGILALFFLLPNNVLVQSATDALGLTHIEVRPSWTATGQIIKDTIKEDPFFGVGPGRFGAQWFLHKPAGVNQTIFWNTDFNAGAGVLPTFVVTSGLVGLLAWLLFLGWFVWTGVRHALGTSERPALQQLILASFVGAVYLWVVSLLYVPHTALFTLAFVLSGITIGLLARAGKISSWELSFMQNPKVGFFSVFGVVVLLIASIALFHLFAQRALALNAFRSGVAIAQTDLVKGEAKLARAAELYPHDGYYRVLADLERARLQALLSQPAANQEVVREEFQRVLSNAILVARRGASYDDTNYQNWMTLARVYEFLIPLQIDGAYQNARAAYDEALKRNPTSPAIYLSAAQMELAKNDRRAARAEIEKALSQKDNYTEAVFLLAQLEAAEGNLPAAIRESEKAALLAPSEGSFFQLGFLRYQRGDYQGAIGALERSVALNPVYANAKYFLGLAYAKVGRRADAIVQFEGIESTNPDNAEVKKILANLRAGRDPFADNAAPKPESRKKPPINE